MQAFQHRQRVFFADVAPSNRDAERSLRLVERAASRFEAKPSIAGFGPETLGDVQRNTAESPAKLRSELAIRRTMASTRGRPSMMTRTA